MKLTHFKLCPFSRCIRLILSEFAAKPVLEDVRPWTPSASFLTRNPAATLPVLTLADGLTLCGAYPIAEYLADAQSSGLDLSELLAKQKTPADDQPPRTRTFTLLPGDIEDRAEVRRLADWFNYKCDREVTQEFLYEKVRAVLDPGKFPPPNSDLLRTARANLRYHMQYIGFLADQRSWLAGDTMSYADFVAAAHISVIDFLGEIHWSDHPHAQEWYQRIKSRRSFRSLLQDRVPGVVPPPHYPELDF